MLMELIFLLVQAAGILVNHEATFGTLSTSSILTTAGHLVEKYSGEGAFVVVCFDMFF